MTEKQDASPVIDIAAPKRKRLFLGSFVPENMKTICSNRLVHEKLHWTNIDRLHITWQFLGHQDSECVADIKALLKQMEPNYFPIEIKFDQVKIWPDVNRPRQLVWVGNITKFGHKVKLDDEIMELEKGIQENLKNLDIEKDDLDKTKKLFVKDLRSRLEQICEFESKGQLVPHITLGRFKRRTKGTEIKLLENYGLPETKWDIDGMDLIESKLSDDGAEYTVL